MSCALPSWSEAMTFGLFTVSVSWQAARLRAPAVSATVAPRRSIGALILDMSSVMSEGQVHRDEEAAEHRDRAVVRPVEERGWCRRLSAAANRVEELDLRIETRISVQLPDREVATRYLNGCVLRVRTRRDRLRQRVTERKLTQLDEVRSDDV